MADGIEDFEIKGISLGQSLFDHFVKEDVLYYDAYGHKWDNPKFKDIIIRIKKNGKNFPTNSPKFDSIESIYDSIQLTWQIDSSGNGDFNNFKVKALSGILYYEVADNNCANDRQEIISDLDKLFVNLNYTFHELPEKIFYKLDPTGKSSISLFHYNLETGEGIQIECTYIRNNELLKNKRYQS